MSEFKDRQRLLVAALRSGEFKQAKNQLAIVHEDAETRYCCLGVACEVAIANGLDLEKVESLTEEGTIVYNGVGDELPSAVRDWYGLDDRNPVLIEDAYDDDQVTCIKANDDLDYTFDKIANLMEKAWEL